MAVAAYLKVIRRRKPSSAEGTRWGRARDGGYSPSHKGGGGLGGLLEAFFSILSASMCVFNGVLSVWDQILVVLVTKIFLVA